MIEVAGYLLEMIMLLTHVATQDHLVVAMNQAHLQMVVLAVEVVVMTNTFTTFTEKMSKVILGDTLSWQITAFTVIDDSTIRINYTKEKVVHINAIGARVTTDYSKDVKHTWFDRLIGTTLEDKVFKAIEKINNKLEKAYFRHSKVEKVRDWADEHYLSQPHKITMREMDLTSEKQEIIPKIK